MPARSQAQAIWARLGCRGSKMSAEKCAEFVPHGKGSMMALPKRVIPVEAIRRAGRSKR